MTRPPEGAQLHRFPPTVRWVHRLVGGLMAVCIATAAVLYVNAFAVLVGHRYVIEQVHVWSGYALPVPLLAGLASRAYRGELGLLNRFSADDWRWLRAADRRSGRIAVGKYNAGQKLNAALSAGAIAVLLLSGTVMFLPRVTPLGWRVGATFVHDWTALAVGVLVLGHLHHALRDPAAMAGMRTGYVPRDWAQREHARWAAETEDA